MLYRRKLAISPTDFWTRFYSVVQPFWGGLPTLMPTFPAAFRNLAGEGAIFLRKNRINPAVFRMFSISPWSVFCRLRGFFAFLTVFSLFSGFPFYTYGQSAGKHVGNECGGLFHPLGGDYHRHYRRGRQSNHNRDNRNCPRNRTDPQSTR